MLGTKVLDISETGMTSQRFWGGRRQIDVVVPRTMMRGGDVPRTLLRDDSIPPRQTVDMAGLR